MILHQVQMVYTSNCRHHGLKLKLNSSHGHCQGRSRTQVQADLYCCSSGMASRTRRLLSFFTPSLSQRNIAVTSLSSRNKLRVNIRKKGLAVLHYDVSCYKSNSIFKYVYTRNVTICLEKTQTDVSDTDGCSLRFRVCDKIIIQSSHWNHH